MSIIRQVFLYAGHDTKPLLKRIPFSKYLSASIRSYWNHISKGSYRENKHYVKHSGTSKPSTHNHEMELNEYKHPIVSDTGYPKQQTSDDDLRSQHQQGGIMRTDRFEIHTEDNV
ncbi:MAG: hypothetical protein Q9209_004747 [Squamulea sp. 1 TL-2023]